MAQFFEIRYSKGFRVFAGILAFVSGILNYGIFPAVGARFFVNYCGLPQTLSLAGTVGPDVRRFDGVLHQPGLVSHAGRRTIDDHGLRLPGRDLVECSVRGWWRRGLLCIIPWSDIYTALAAAPKGQSMLNPFDTGRARDFNIWYVLIGIFILVYNYMSWQGGYGFRSAACQSPRSQDGRIPGHVAGLRPRGDDDVARGLRLYVSEPSQVRRGRGAGGAGAEAHSRSSRSRIKCACRWRWHTPCRSG